MCRYRHNLALLLLLLVAAGAFCAGIQWGLPGRDDAHLLFGETNPIWTGDDILARSENLQNEANRASDVDANPVDRSRLVLLNATDAQRAEIVRRYRLFTYQPDEMQTMMALAEMNPGQGQLDPKNYKYGGLWIYPVGALLKVASMAGLVELKSDPAYYLDHPQAFGRFYIVARAYTVFWAVVGVWAVWWIVRRLCNSPSPGTPGEGRGEGSVGNAECRMQNAESNSAPHSALPSGLSLRVEDRTSHSGENPHPNPLPAYREREQEDHREMSVLPAFFAALCFIFMPVVMNMTHEAKPHLPGAVLILLTAMAGMKYLDTAGRRWIYICGALAGAATGMVPAAWVAFLVLAAIALRQRSIRAAILPGFAGVFVYFLTNPFVAINLVMNRELLESNFGNTADFYHLGFGAIPTAAKLVRAGMSPLLMIAGVIGTAGLAMAMIRRRALVERWGAMSLIAIPALASGAQFVLFAADQPPDFARFALTLDIALLIGAVVAIDAAIRSAAGKVLLLAILSITTIIAGSTVLQGFIRDSRPTTSRSRAAIDLEHYKLIGARRLVVFAEPAPYCLPPVDLFGWQVVLVPKDADPEMIAGGDVVIRVDPAENDWFGRSVSWADKRFKIDPTLRFLGLDKNESEATMQPDN